MRRFKTFVFWGLVTALLLVWAYRLTQFIFAPALGHFSDNGPLTLISWLGVLGGVVLPAILIFLAALLPGFLALRAWRWAGLTVLTLVLEAVPLSLTSMPPFRSGDMERASDFKVAIYNMHADRQALAKFASHVQDTDIIFLAEAPARLDVLSFDRLFPNHSRHQIAYLPGFAGNLVILAKGSPTLEVHMGENPLERPIFDMRLVVEGQEVRALATHALAPFTPSMMAHRNRTLSQLRALARQDNAPTLILGDLNTTPFEPAAWRLPGQLVGNPFRPSWNGTRHILHMRIDHIRLLQGDKGFLTPVQQRVGPDLGSDHLPVFASFSIEIP